MCALTRAVTAALIRMLHAALSCPVLCSRYLPSSFVTASSALAPSASAWHLSSGYGLFRHMTGTRDGDARGMRSGSMQPGLVHPGAGVAVGRPELEVLGSSDGQVRRGRGGAGRGACSVHVMSSAPHLHCLPAVEEEHADAACLPACMHARGE